MYAHVTKQKKLLNCHFPILNLLCMNKHCVLIVQEIVVGSNMDKIYIVMDFIKHDLKALMGTMKEKFLEGSN